MTAEPPLGYLLHRLTSALRADVVATALQPHALSFAQYVCLRMLQSAPGRSNAELARSMGVSPQAMNIVLISLQERGLATRPATAAAGRARPTALTAAARTMLTDLDGPIRAAEERVLHPLNDGQRADLRQLLGLAVGDATGTATADPPVD